MEYSNPRIPEGINVGSEHPLKEFAQLLLGLGALVSIGAAVLGWSASWIAPYVPFEIEARVAANYEAVLPSPTPETEYLRTLAARLSASRPLPDGMHLHLHFIDSPVVNAMATVGGHVFVFRGLLDAMPNENALAMVLAHEIAHVKHRDPIVALGRSVAIGLGLSALGLTTGQNAANSALSQAGLLTTLTFTRNQEREADREGLAALAALYGHVAGADTAFERLREKAGFDESFVPELWRTHPGSGERIERIHALAKETGYSLEGPLTPLPESLRTQEKAASALVHSRHEERNRVDR